MLSQPNEVIDEVFIKEVRENGIDYVSFVRNLPRHFVYEQVPKMIMKVDKEGYTEGHRVPDPAGGFEWQLKLGLEHSLNGDKSIVFQVKYEDGQRALQAIDDYVDRLLPREQIVPDRLPYPMDPKDPRSNPRPLDMIPKITLPLPGSKREESGVISPTGASAPVSLRPSRHFSAEHKEKLRKNIAKAREARKARRKE